MIINMDLGLVTKSSLPRFIPAAVITVMLCNLRYKVQNLKGWKPQTESRDKFKCHDPIRPAISISLRIENALPFRIGITQALVLQRRTFRVKRQCFVSPTKGLETAHLPDFKSASQGENLTGWHITSMAIGPDDRPMLVL